MNLSYVDKVPGYFDREHIIVFSTNSDQKIRQAISTRNVDILLDPHRRRVKKKIHQQDSGLNHILVKLAAKNNVAIGFSMDVILEDSQLHSRVFGQIMQNIRLCEKYCVPIVIFPNKNGNNEDIKALFRIFGARNLSLVEDFSKQKIRFKKEYVRDGVMKVLSKDL